ncbi:MAG: TldD/PmbA family protein [Brevefilum sp.]
MNDHSPPEELALHALNVCEQLGAAYSDVRSVSTVTEYYAVANGQVVNASDKVEAGMGIRVLVDGAWGFAFCDGFNREDLEKACKRAVALGQIGAEVNRRRVDIGSPVISSGSYHTPVIMDPFAMDIEDKLRPILDATKAMRSVHGIVNATGTMEFIQRDTQFFSNEGSRISQTIVESGAGLAAVAAVSNEVQRRTFPTNLLRQQGTGGFELIQNLNLVENGSKITQEAIDMCSAIPCPQGEFDVIMDPTLLAQVLHELVGHNTELDRIFGSERGYAGTSFVSPDLSTPSKYGSPLINVYFDSTYPGGLGTFGYDDEGVPAQRNDLIKNGMVVGFHTSRETAARIGKESNGCMRADGHHGMPIVRMTNLILKPGEWPLEELIADTDHGILMSVNQSWSIDERREMFDYSAQFGYEINGGKIGRMIKAPTFRGRTLELWNSVDAICNEDSFKVYGLPICGKGEPWQGGPVSHGCSPARFRSLCVGG